MRPRDLGASGSAEAPRLPLPAGRILPAPRSRPHCARASSAPLGSRVGGGHLPDPASGHRRCVPVCLTEGQGLRLLRSGLQRPLPCWVAGWAWGGPPLCLHHCLLSFPPSLSPGPDLTGQGEMEVKSGGDWVIPALPPCCVTSGWSLAFSVSQGPL
jgi:hypothetical protein